MCIEAPARRQRGISMIELIMFIVIVGVGVAGIVSVLNITAAKSADPLPVKQALAIAESLLEETELAAYTWCDPADPAVLTATSTADCTIALPGSVAGSARPRDHVKKYDGFATTGIADLNGTPIAGLGAYNASITAASAALGTVPAGAALLITVTVTGPGGTNISLSGYRTRYAPNSVP